MRRVCFTFLLAAALGVFYSGTATAAPGDTLGQIFPADSTFGVSVAFDGQFLYYTNLDGTVLHRIKPDGTGHQDFAIFGPLGVNAFAFDATRDAFWAADSSGLGIWLIPKPAPTDVAVVGTLQFTINPVTDTPGDCDNGAGCNTLVDGLAYDGFDDSIWYSPDGSQRIYHYDAGSFLTAIFAVPNFIDVNDPPNDMAPECGGVNYSSGVAAGAKDLWLTADGCPRYFQYSKTGTKIANFPYDSVRAEDDECDNITFAPLNALWVRDIDGRLAAFEQPIECKFGGGVAAFAEKGRMTGGARLFATIPLGAEPQITVTIHCDPSVNPNRMEVNWKDPATGQSNRFHMTSMTSATCTDDPTIAPNPPGANFDTHDGTGTGRYDGVLGATADWRLQDAGEPGTGNDRGRITIKDASGTTVLIAPLGPTLDGDWQAHNTK
jgi:hypothetical protein